MALRDSLISWWEMEESSGTRVDSHGTNDLGDINTVGVATGKQGNGADFESANTEYLKIAYASQTDLDYAGSADFTYQMWVKPESISATWMQLWDHFNSNKGSQAIINSTKLTFYVPNGSIHTNWQPTISGGFSAGTWYHLIFQFDGSAQQARIFVNGTVVGAGWTSATFGSPFPTAPIDPTTDFSIGADASAGGSPFDGIIDEFAFWERVLSDAEVAELYNSGAGLSYADTAGNTNVTVNPVAQSITASIPAYTVKKGITKTPSAQVVTASIPAYTVRLPKTVSVSPQSIVASIPAYVVDAGGNITVAAQAQVLNLSVPAYSILRGFVFSPSPQTLTLSTTAASLSLGSGVVVSPEAQVATLSIATPTLSIQRSIIISVATQLLTLTLPTLAKVGGVWSKRARQTDSDWGVRSRQTDSDWSRTPANDT